MKIQETLLIIDTWDHESRNAGLALRLGDQPNYGITTTEWKGAFVDNGGNRETIVLEVFRGETEVYYTEDGQRHVFLAGRPLGSGIGASWVAASNAVIVELPILTRPLPAVFSTDERFSYRIHRISLERKIQSLEESPFFVSYDREQQIRVMQNAKKLVPPEIAKKMSRPRPLATGPLPSEFWIPFNRLKHNQVWIDSVGAVCLSENGISTVVTNTSIMLNKGACLGAVCSPNKDLVILAEVL